MSNYDVAALKLMVHAKFIYVRSEDRYCSRVTLFNISADHEVMKYIIHMSVHENLNCFVIMHKRQHHDNVHFNPVANWYEVQKKRMARLLLNWRVMMYCTARLMVKLACNRY